MGLILAIVKGFIGRNGLVVALAAGLVTFGLLYDQSRVSHGRSIERAETETRNEKKITTARAARDRAGDARAGGVRDPHTSPD